MSSSTRHEAPPSMIRRSLRLIRRTKPIEAAADSVSQFEAATAFLQNRYDQWARARHNLSVAIGAQHEAQYALDEQIRGVFQGHGPSGGGSEERPRPLHRESSRGHGPHEQGETS